jgi:hypothetical protein
LGFCFCFGFPPSSVAIGAGFAEPTVPSSTVTVACCVSVLGVSALPLRKSLCAIEMRHMALGNTAMRRCLRSQPHGGIAERFEMYKRSPEDHCGATLSILHSNVMWSNWCFFFDLRLIICWMLNCGVLAFIFALKGWGFPTCICKNCYKDSGIMRLSKLIYVCLLIPRLERIQRFDY